VTRHRYVLALGSNVRHVRLGRPADVVRAAFGSGDKTAQVLAAALEGRNNMLQAMSAIGQVTVTDKGLEINADAKPDDNGTLWASQMVASDSSGTADDDLFMEAVEFLRDGGNVLISAIQRKLRVGYNRAANILEAMEDKGLLSAPGSDGRRKLTPRIHLYGVQGSEA